MLIDELKALFKRENKAPKTVRTEVPVFRAKASYGLTAAQVSERFDAGWANTPVEPPGKTVGQIVSDNVFTYFNMIFMILALCVIAVGSWQNLMFMFVVIVNTVIGIAQELKAKITLDKLILLSEPNCTVIRSGREQTIAVSDAVRDDIVLFNAGNEIFADAVVVEGSCAANEALITGEAHDEEKNPGDSLLSGSFLAAGSCLARLTHVGADSYASQLTIKAREQKPPQESEMMRSLGKLVKVIGILIIPLGLLMAFKEIYILEASVKDGILATVASLVGMIPEGLYLLTTLALLAGVLRLSKQKTLVKEVATIESLARADVLCVDKTGTITSEEMQVEELVPLCPERYNSDDLALVIQEYLASQKADNATLKAIRDYFGSKGDRIPQKILPFSSSRKYGAVSFFDDESYVLGAPDVILADRYYEVQDLVEESLEHGNRILLLSHYDRKLGEGGLESEGLLPLALIALKNKIRPAAAETFSFFRDEGVDIKVISGDNALAVSKIAESVGIENAGRYIDARSLSSDEEIERAILSHTVIGRVSPEQKQKFVKALKRNGHTVAMTGDGVNDVLALKEADCSIAMASGSDAASRVSHIVLLNSDFSSMPQVVAEGRRVINNIERSATLFLVKNIFSLILAIISLIFTFQYPFTPAHLSLVNTLTIGIPGFFLAMEPNSDIVSGRFLQNVIRRALPGALSNVFLVLFVVAFFAVFPLQRDMAGTVCASLIAAIGFIMVYEVSKPLTKLRKLMFFVLLVGFVVSAVFLKDLFTLAELDAGATLILIVFLLLAFPVFKAMSVLLKKLYSKFDELLVKANAFKNREKE